MSSEIFASSNGLADRSIAREAPDEPEEPTTQAKKEDEAFVIKRGAKRKSDAVSDEEESEEEDSNNFGKRHIPTLSRITVEDLTAALEGRAKAAEKAARKAEKRAKKAAKKAAAAAAVGGDTEDAGEVDDEKPFDYSKADSVLHGKRHDGEKGGPKKEKPFDPYRKSEDAPKGMRRLQTERAGKSHTFKG
jgi:exosome complex exonuclease RRP6